MRPENATPAAAKSGRRIGVRKAWSCLGADRGIAQLVERRSPKPKVAGSIPVAPAEN